MAQEKGALKGRKMRVDTTVVETNIHYPTDSSLLGDGARVLTRTMKRDRAAGGKLKRKVRDRTRSVNKRVRALRWPAGRPQWASEERRNKQYRELLRYSRQILNDSQARDQGSGTDAARERRDCSRLADSLSQMAELGTPGVKQTKARVFQGHHAVAGQDRQLVRTAHRNHPQRQGQQADRVRQAGADAGSRESDHHAL